MISFMLLVAVFSACLAQRILQDVIEKRYGNLWLYATCFIGLTVAVYLKSIGL